MPSQRLFIPLLFLFHTLSVFSQSDPADRLAALIKKDSIFEAGEYAHHDKPVPDISPDAIQRRASFYKSELEDLRQIPVSGLSEQERINYELLYFVIRDRLDQIEFKTYLVPLDAEGGWFTDFILSAGRTRFSSGPDAEKYIQSLSAFHEYASQQIQYMKDGLAIGKTAPYVILKGREGIVQDQLVSDPEQSPFFLPLLALPADIPEEEQNMLKLKAREAIQTSVIPAFHQFNDFWQNEYIPGAVRTTGISSQPSGKEFYLNRIQHFTTLDLTPEEVFDTGKKEVARIRKEMEQIIKETGFSGDFEGFLTFLRSDEQFYAKSPDELLMHASFIAKKIDGKLPEYFGKLPRNSYGVMPVPAKIAPTYTGGRYSPGSLADARAGNYWVNTYNLPARPLYVLPSLTLHEAVPGHHLQISLAQEMENMPSFRRNTYLSAYGEGWALYGEWLGEEMGIYTTPYERFGKLTYEMWRACRLVIDPGLHLMGWTREQAIEFMSQHTALSLHECTTEIDRYIGWPGQAVSYKIGELKIRELRALAENKLGDKFDLRVFHDLILSNGAVPLFVLDRMVQQWIKANS